MVELVKGTRLGSRTNLRGIYFDVAFGLESIRDTRFTKKKFMGLASSETNSQIHSTLLFDTELRKKIGLLYVLVV